MKKNLFKVMLIGIVAFAAGCATIEVSKPPAVLKPAAPAAPESVGNPSPPALPETVQAPETPAPVEPGAPLKLTVEGALVLALENNRDLAVQEVNPALRQTYVSEARSVFDPVLTADYTVTDDRVATDQWVRKSAAIANTNSTVTYWTSVDNASKTYTDSRSASLAQHLPTGGDVSVTVEQGRTSLHRTTSDFAAKNALVDADTDSPSLTFQVTQSLLRGAGLNVNLASLRQARLDQRLSEYEVRGIAEDLVSQTEQAYWDYVLAQLSIAIYQKAEEVARTQLDLVNAQIEVGRLPETERAATAAELASRQSALIDAKSTLAQTRLALVRLMNPSPEAMQGTDVVTMSDPILPEIPLDAVETSVRLAQRMRPDINQARLQLERDNLEVVKTKNGLLPQLDLFLQLSRNVNDTEYARSFVAMTEDLKDTRNTTQVGVQFAYPIGNRAARARDQRARFARKQDRLALANMEQLIEQDVRSAYIEIERARAQIDATAATRKSQEESQLAETEKFQIGRSNVLLVAQAQRDLLNAQIGEVQAKINYLNDIVNLYRLEGTLLERRGVACPGREQVTLTDSQIPPAATFEQDFDSYPSP